MSSKIKSQPKNQPKTQPKNQPKTQTQIQPKTQTQIQHQNEEFQNNMINHFNLVVISMIRHLTDYYNDPSMTQLRIVLEEIIIETPDEPIAQFIMKIYKNDDHRRSILASSDNFYTSAIGSMNTNNMNTTKERLFEFNNLWNQIDDDTKSFIKKSMKTLVKICQQYILSL